MVLDLQQKTRQIVIKRRTIQQGSDPQRNDRQNQEIQQKIEHKITQTPNGANRQKTHSQDI